MKMSKLVGLALLTGLGACAHTAGNTLDEDDASAELREHHRHHYRGGVAQFIAMSLDTIGEDEAQHPAIEALQGELATCLAPSRVIEAKLTLIFADGVGAGSLPRRRSTRPSPSSTSPRRPSTSAASTR